MALVHHWPLGEASGTRADSIGELDLSPEAGDSVSAATGLIGDALNATGAFDSITSGTERAIDIDGADCFSVSFAAFFNNAAGTREVLVSYSNATTTMLLIERVAGGEIQATVRNQADTDYVVTGTTVTAALTWYYVTVTFSRNGAVMLFIDAVCEGTTPTADSPWHSVEASPRFYLASRQASLDKMDGRLDEVSIDSDALSTGQIVTLYNGGALTNRPASYTGDFTTGLAHYWNLEESSGSRADLAGGVPFAVTDDAGNGPGILNDGMIFDGSAYLDTTTPLGYDGADQTTISLWVRFNDAFGTRQAMMRSSTIAGTPLTYIIDRRETGLIDSRFWNSAGTNSQNQSTITIGAGVWTHLCATYRRNGVQRLYINGTQLNAPERFRNDLPLRDQSADFSNVIGFTRQGVLPLLDATIDEIAIWSRALTSGDIAAYYNSGSPSDLTPVSGGDIRRRFSNGFYRSWT